MIHKVLTTFHVVARESESAVGHVLTLSDEIFNVVQASSMCLPSRGMVPQPLVLWHRILALLKTLVTDGAAGAIFEEGDVIFPVLVAD